MIGNILNARKTAGGTESPFRWGYSDRIDAAHPRRLRVGSSASRSDPAR
jgi:hypothetical protein